MATRALLCGDKKIITQPPKPKLLVICGPTASGKTGWGLKLAKKFGGYVISADSRQIYKGLDIGTDKVKGRRGKIAGHACVYAEGVPHFMIDIAGVNKEFTVADYQKRVYELMSGLRIRKQQSKKACPLCLRGRRATKQSGGIPILVGGTGMYINAVLDNWQFLPGKADKKLRQKLAKKTREELLAELKKLDPVKAKNIDKNKRRIIRAIEACQQSGKPVSQKPSRGEPLFDVLMIAPLVPRARLYKKINKRVKEMVDRGLAREVKKMAKKYGWNKPAMSGLGYGQFRDYFAGKITLDEVVDKIQTKTRQYARRQMTWFKRDGRIRWVESYKEAERVAGEFLR